MPDYRLSLAQKEPPSGFQEQISRQRFQSARVRQDRDCAGIFVLRCVFAFRMASFSSTMCILDECPYLTGVLLSLDLNTTTHIDSPGMNSLNRFCDVFRC